MAIEGASLAIRSTASSLSGHRSEKGSPLPNEPQTPKSSLWTEALAKYKSVLNDPDYDDEIFQTPGPEELVTYVKSMTSSDAVDGLQSAAPPARGFAEKLWDSLRHPIDVLIDLTAAVAFAFGAQPQVSALVWGSIKTILKLTKPPDRVSMVEKLDEVTSILPSFHLEGKPAVENPRLRSLIIDMYVSFILFCARTISHINDDSNFSPARQSWNSFCADQQRTIVEIRKLRDTYRSVFDNLQLMKKSSATAEIAEMVARSVAPVAPPRYENGMRLPYRLLPRRPLSQLWGRESELESLTGICQRGGGWPESPTSVILHGMGGIGKTQLALTICATAERDFDIILWIPSETKIKIIQALTEVAQDLGLLEANSEAATDDYRTVKTVRSWIEDNPQYRFLLVLDNVEDSETLDFVRPRSFNGVLLVTSRSTAMNRQFTQALQIKPFDLEATPSIFTKMLDVQPEPDEGKIVGEICAELGGLPLALTQIAGFINSEGVSLAELWGMYQSSAADLYSTEVPEQQYEHTISTVWDASLRRLPSDSRTIMQLAAFLDPDAIPKKMLQNVKSRNEQLQFLSNDVAFNKACGRVVRQSLLDHNPKVNRGLFRIHRLVQNVILSALSPQEATLLVDGLTQMLANSFPNTWHIVTSHQIAGWQSTSECLPHVNALMKAVAKFAFQPTNRPDFAELIFRCAWYLYEKEQYSASRAFIENGLEYVDKLEDDLLHAGASNLLGLLDLDLANPVSAITRFETALAIREKRLDPDDPLIASLCNNLGIACTETCDLKMAIHYHERALQIRLTKQPDRLGNTYSNYAATLLAADRPNDAEEMLGRCPSLKDFTDQTFLQTKNPRFSGDMVLLSRIRAAQGRHEDAMSLAASALLMRRELLSDGSAKVADSRYLMAILLSEDGEQGLAVQMLKLVVDECKGKEDLAGHLARALWMLATLHAELGDRNEALRYGQEAEAVRLSIEGQSQDGFEASDTGYSRLVPWMLW